MAFSVFCGSAAGVTEFDNSRIGYGALAAVLAALWHKKLLWRGLEKTESSYEQLRDLVKKQKHVMAVLASYNARVQRGERVLAADVDRSFGKSKGKPVHLPNFVRALTGGVSRHYDPYARVRGASTPRRKP